MTTEPSSEDLEALRLRLQEAEETILAIRSGAVDGFVIEMGPGQGHRVYTLEGAERPYRILVEKMQQGAATLGADGTIVYSNQCLADLLGLPLERIVGIPLADLVFDGDGICGTLLREGASGAAQAEALLRGPLGHAIPVLLTLNTMLPESGTAFGLLVTDLTAQRHQEKLLETLATLRSTEEALRKVADDLSASNRRKDEFLATLAHELRNPLAPIRSALQVMGLTKDAAVVDRARHIAERQVQHMVRLVDDLLDVSRITQDKLKLRKQTVALSDIVRDAVEANQALIDRARQALTVTLPPDPVWLDVDAARITQVLANLLNNAAKYTPERGRIALTATVERDAVDRTQVCIRVSDSGIGIRSEMLPRIFDMFTQVDSTLDRSQGGLGIGLTLVRRLVQMHGGTVEAASGGAGRGSVFTVRLPFDGSLAHAASSDRTPRPALASSLRVLVVDDNADAAESLAVLLRLMGHEVRLADEGRAAIDLAVSFNPQVVLMDIGLPGMSGYDVARTLRQRPQMRGTTLVAVTGWGQDSDRQRAWDTGFDHHLTKPIEPELLEKILASVRAHQPAS